MKTLSILVLGLVVGLCAVAHVDAAAQYGRPNDRAREDQVCVYKDINYQGAEQCYSGNNEISNLGAQSNSISSIRVYGRATVTVYENTAFRGRSTQFTSNVADLGQRMMSGNTAWSDHIQSLRIEDTSVSGNPNSGDRRNPGDFRRDQPQQPRDGVCVYDRPNYEGRSECWNEGQNISDLARQGNWDGQISSIRLYGRSVAVVYQDIGYRGESLTVDRDIPDLAAIRERGTGNGRGRGNGNGRGRGNGRSFENWDHQISSMQVQSQRRNR
jgi:peptidase inhibitor family I36